MKKTFLVKIVTLIILSVSGIASAAESTKATHHMDKMKHMEMTAEQRILMAATHEKMATCLRSDKSMENCKMEMMNSCQEKMAKESCAMMGEMH